VKDNRKYWESTNENISAETKRVLNEYLLSLKLANKSEATITKYLWILERFFCDCSTPLACLTDEDVLHWLNEFSVDKKPKTMDLVFSCLSSFFKFCLEEDYLVKMVIKKRWRPKLPQSLPRFLSEQDYAHVKLASESLSIRNRALILFLFSSGCRVSEVSNLNIQDVDLKRRTAVVKGKGKKIRHVHFSEECAIVLIDYLKARSFKETDALFINSKGRRFRQNGIYAFTTSFGRKIGLIQSLHPHCFRHTFATNMLARGASLEFIADEMGHANLNTTRIYARIPTEDMMLAYQNKMG
jgi:integrase/recombinase XerD